MSTDSSETTRPLPDRPNLRHLKDQAKDLMKDLLKAGQGHIPHSSPIQNRPALWIRQLASAESSR